MNQVPVGAQDMDEILCRALRDQNRMYAVSDCARIESPSARWRRTIMFPPNFDSIVNHTPPNYEFLPDTATHPHRKNLESLSLRRYKIVQRDVRRVRGVTGEDLVVNVQGACST